MITKATALLAALAMGFAVSAAQAADPAHEDAQLTNAKVSLNEAIGIAEQQGSGQAISADYKAAKKGSPGAYSVKVLSTDGKNLTAYHISSNTGKVKKASEEPFEKLFTRIKPTELQNAPTSLKTAIKTAESETGGKVIDADTDRTGDSVRYTLKVAKADGTTEKMKVNGADGKVAMK